MWQSIATYFLYAGRKSSPLIVNINNQKNRKAIQMLVALAIKLTLLTMTASLLAYVYISYMAPHM